MNSRVAPSESTALYRYTHPPLTGYPLGDVGLIYSLRVVGWPELGPAFLFQNRSVSLDPAVDGGMVDRQTAFSHHFFQISITERVSEISAQAKEDDFGLIVAVLEQVGSAHERVSLYSQLSSGSPTVANPSGCCNTTQDHTHT
jgi:hypothetical protein